MDFKKEKKREAVKTEEIKSVKEVISGAVRLLAVGTYTYIVLELLSGNLLRIPLPYALLNIAWILVVYIFLFALSSSRRFAVIAGSGCLYLYALTQTFILLFREWPTTLWDIASLSTAMSVTGSYTFSVTWQMVVSAILLFILWAASFCFCRRRACPFKNGRLRVYCLGGCLAFGVLFYIILAPLFSLELPSWAMASALRTRGCVLFTALNLRYAYRGAPDGYGREGLEHILEAYGQEEDWQGEEEVTKPVNLICIMNESLADMRVDGDFSVNEEYFPFLSSMNSNVIKGKLCMPVFGAMTGNSEFEFLTGDSMALLPQGVIAYNFFVREEETSLVSTLKAEGYETVAMHPYPGDNWNRRTVYERMGFDRFLDEDFYEGSEILRKYVSDRADYEKIIEVVNAKENPDDRLFIFNVTMQNHGGYEELYENFTQEVYLTGTQEGKYPKADQFLSLMKRSDEALSFLISYFETVDEPTMIVVFGDHQPGLEAAFFDELAGRDRTTLTPQETLSWFETPFFIWTNYENKASGLVRTGATQVGKLGAVYLSSRVLEAAGLRLTPYNRFLLAMSEVFPVLHLSGFYDAQGGYLSWEEAEMSGFSEMILNYEALVYNHRFDKDRLKALFVLEQE